MSSIIQKPIAKPSFFEKWGSFGRFQTGLSYPVEYVLTTFTVAELQHLTFAQTLKPTEPDFELLMQRDIDIDRVDREIIKYLSPPKKTEAELRTKPTFFPPLLAAIVPVRGRDMMPYLPSQQVQPFKLGTADGLLRSWGKIVRISYYRNDDSSLTYRPTHDGAGGASNGNESVGVELFPVRVEVKEAAEFGNEEGIRLVVIDGQHRLAAITKLAKADPEYVANLIIPVCLIIAPESTDSVASSKPDLTLTVPRVFRELFVDVNKNALAVGGHFNSLLSDSDLGKISVRVFCEQVLAKYGREGLALVEWNIRSAKDATQIKRRYSMTSIGVIELGLSRGIGNKPRNRGLLKRLLSLGLVEPQLYPEDVGYEYPKQIEWDRFSPAQKVVLEGQIRSELIQKGLLRIFFEPDEFREVFEQFKLIVAEYDALYKEKGDDFAAVGAVLQQVLEYRPISETDLPVQSQLKRFGDAVAARYETRTNPVIRYSIFQRAMIHAWLELIGFLRNRDDISIDNITSAFVGLLNFCLNRERAIFSDRTRRYMVHAVFKSPGVIKATESSRLALAALIQACLANRKVLTAFADKLGVAKDDKLRDELFDFGFAAASFFATHFQSQRREDFIGSWVTDFSLPQDERDELRVLDEALTIARKELREKTATKEDAQKAEGNFLLCVNHHVGTDVDLAIKELKDALGYDVEIALDNTIDGGQEEE
jgi:hypothetical protein